MNRKLYKGNYQSMVESCSQCYYLKILNDHTAQIGLSSFFIDDTFSINRLWSIDGHYYIEGASSIENIYRLLVCILLIFCRQKLVKDLLHCQYLRYDLRRV